MTEDPIVEEVHKVRERLLEKYGSTEGLRETWRAIEQEFADRVVNLPPRPPTIVDRKMS